MAETSKVIPAAGDLIERDRPHLLMLFAVSRRTVAVFGSLFWLCGAIATSVMAVKNIAIYSFAASDAPSSHSRKILFACVSVGVGILSLMFYLPFAFLPLARNEIQRIHDLKAPRPWHLFEKWRLLALCVFIPPLAVLNNLWADKYFIGALVFGAMVLPVSIGLASGVVLIGRKALFAPRCYWQEGNVTSRITETLLNGGEGGAA